MDIIEREINRITLSIIIPVYKVERYIRKCLESIYKQNIAESIYEIIVVNDGSPDTSIEIVSEFESVHSNLTIINQENQGLSVARNTGLRYAKGQYVWFVDSDDWLASDSLQSVFHYLHDNKYDIISSDLIYSYDDDNNNWSVNRKDDCIVAPEQYLINYPVGAVQRYIIKRSFLLDNQLYFYPGIYHEDAEFAPRMIILSKGVFMLSKHVYHYYQRENSIMSSWKLKNTQDYCFVAKKHLTFSEAISSQSLKTSFRYFTLMVYLCAFPSRQIRTNKDVKALFNNEKKEIRSLAASLATKKLPLKKLLRVWLCMVSPVLVISNH